MAIRDREPARPERGTIAAKAREQRDTTSWAAATAQQLLNRHGILTRESVAAETLAGGYGVIYSVLKAMEESGRIRRGYFVAGLGAMQFAVPGALELVRAFRDSEDEPVVVSLAATDPANPYGATLKWTSSTTPGIRADVAKEGRGPTRTVGALVILVDGALAAYLARGERQLLTWIPDSEPTRSHVARNVARTLIERARAGGDTPRGMLIETIDNAPASTHALASYFVEAGFAAGAMGLQGVSRGNRA